MLYAQLEKREDFVSKVAVSIPLCITIVFKNVN